jgi:mRNA interferase MazF
VICDRYDVAVIPFPFAEIPVLKRRPAVVLSGQTFNTANNSSLVAMITSSTQTRWPSDVPLRDLGTAGLRIDCLVRWRLTTVPNDLIVRRLGKLGGLDRLACEREFANMIA